MKNVLSHRKLKLHTETVLHLKELSVADLRQVQGGTGKCTKTTQADFG